ncbi:pirin family protein [Streptomyces sp. MST-110588]|uniref:pirin family protein n=1 Tax=Streptomyces sp. MST-110588 TaxID=2833628 RepID=UPI001F5E1CC6|nr:pirin family protein [Streptomyces sp. MST-110588]UNO42252.1 pirin family protein [Streptomyces sp. MST-110588]
MIEVHGGDERYRGGDADVGIESLHAFSFGPHYDPDNLRFGALTACNEERLAAGAGFGEHPHQDTEIVTWVIEGTLTHRDSTGRATVVRPGDVQRLSSAGGVRHVERNDGPKPLRFVQMWLTPTVFGGQPEYEVVRGIADGTPYALPRAGALLHVRRLAGGERSAVPDAPRVYVHVVRGAVRLGGGEVPQDSRLTAGDAARVTDAKGLEALAEEDAECLIWEMGAEPTYG